jgi:hypothetical protein
MLCFRLTRVTPGRPEALLATGTIAARSQRAAARNPGSAKFDVHVVHTGDEVDMRGEEVLQIDGWDSRRPAIDLLSHALNLAAGQRHMGGEPAVVMSLPLARLLASALECGSRGGQVVIPDDMVDDVRELFAAVRQSELEEANA